MVGNIRLFSEMKDLKQPINVGLLDESARTVKKIGVVEISPRIRLMNVLFLPEFHHNLLPVGKLIQHSRLKVLFDDHGCVFQDLTTKEAVAYGRKLNGLYKLCLDVRKVVEEGRRKRKISQFLTNMLNVIPLL